MLKEKSKKIFFILILLYVVIFPYRAFSDMCCYVVPVQVKMNNGADITGYLIMYGNEIRGFDNEAGNVMKTISFGMNMGSTPDHIGVGLDYEFDSIAIAKNSVTITTGDQTHTVYRVNYFFTPKGLPFASKYWTTKEGYLRYKSEEIPFSELALIKRTGKVFSIAPYAD